MLGMHDDFDVGLKHAEFMYENVNLRSRKLIKIIESVIPKIQRFLSCYKTYHS